MNKKLLVKIFIVLFMIVSNGLIIQYVDRFNMGNMDVVVCFQANKEQTIQLYFDELNTNNWSEEHSLKTEYISTGKEQELSFTIPQESRTVRLDFGDVESELVINNIELHYKGEVYSTKLGSSILNAGNNIKQSTVDNQDIFKAVTGADDPYVVVNFEPEAYEFMDHVHEKARLSSNIFLCFWVDIVLIFILLHFNKIIDVVYFVLVDYKLIFNLAKNDFKTKYAGSYFGILWAFVQPIVTILVYWFVFEIAFKGGPVDGCPYVLWLISGLIPWFFFQEAWQSATNSLIEYSYLVKKVVFNISIIPLVKVLSALFIHIFFVAVLVVIYTLSGYGITVYALQSLYYSICMVLLIIAISYLTSALVIFFRDLGQIIGIMLQIGIWITPIMWNIETISNKTLRLVLQTNPMYYIINGYRESFVSYNWFWNNPHLTIYFWVLVTCLLGIGGVLFHKLKIHFADVL